MEKITPIGGRILVTSRGTHEEVNGIVVPEKLLKDSNVCKTENGETVICKDHAGYNLKEHKRIISEDDIIAVMIGNQIIPKKGWILARKCLDPEDESGVIVSQTKNSNQWAEILKTHDESELRNSVEWFVYVYKTDTDMQKVEETDADWLIKESSCMMVARPEG